MINVRISTLILSYVFLVSDIIAQTSHKQEKMSYMQKTVYEDSIIDNLDSLYRSKEISVDSIISLAVDYEAESYYRVAKHLYQIGSKNGNAKAINNLARIYFNSNPANYQEAFRLFHEAAQKDYAPAYANLGLCLMKGYGTDIDYLSAKQCFEIAEKNDVPSAIYYLGLMYLKGLGVTQNYTKANEYFKRGADLGDIASMVDLAHAYKNGLGCDVDMEKAFQLFKYAADNGNVYAQIELGVIYNGNSKYQNHKLALLYLEAAASQGNAVGQYLIGDIYYSGTTGLKDYAKALKYFKLAAANKDKLPDYALSYIYYYLGVMYRYGRGTEINAEEADYWTKMAAKTGNKEAKEILNI